MGAKKVLISNDGGSTYNEIPGGEGSFNIEGEGIDDTVLGQTFASQEVGLLTWGISTTGIFKGFAGYLAEIKKSGTATVFTAESMTLVSGKTYSIDDATKEIWVRNQSSGQIDFLDAAVPIADADILSIDFLFGQVTFVASFTPGGAVTVTGEFYPTSAIGKGNSYTLTMSADVIDESDFATVQGNGGYRVHASGLRTVTLELGGIFDDVEASAADLEARNELIIEIDAAGDGSSVARGFFKITADNQGGAVGAVEEETVSFTLTVPFDAADKVQDVFNWRHTSTTLATPIQDILTSWLTELNTYDVQYLPTGAIGATPLDGKEGNFVVTDVSLSGGLSDMNTFAAELMGTGAATTV